MDKEKNKEETIKKVLYSHASLKDVVAEGVVQKALDECLVVPKTFIVRQAKNPFKNKDTKVTTQKVEGVSGTCIEDAVPFKATLVDTEIDPVEAINKKYRIVEYSFALDAVMDGDKFKGYSATGFKLLITKLEEVKGDRKNA